jgi:hypothetical protein
MLQIHTYIIITWHDRPVWGQGTMRCSLITFHLTVSYSSPFGIHINSINVQHCVTIEQTALQTILCELTPWSWVILEKLAFAQLLSIFLAFYGTWRFITMLPTSNHWTLSWPSQIQSTSSHYLSHPFQNYPLYLLLDLARSNFSKCSPNSVHISGLSNVCNMLNPSHHTDLIILINDNLPWYVAHLQSTCNSNYLDEEGTEFLILWYVHEHYISEVLHLYASSSTARRELCRSNHCFS